MFSMLTLCIKHIPNINQDYGIDTDLVSIPRYYILVSYRSQNYGIEPSLHSPPFNYKHQKIWLHQSTNYSVYEHLVLATDTTFIPQSMPNHVKQILRDSASSCHVCCDAVFHTYFVVIECVDWNKFVWIKVLFLENHNISYLLYLSRAEMHFGDTWNKCTTLCYLLCLYIISIMFDVLANHRKNLLIQMCRVAL